MKDKELREQFGVLSRCVYGQIIPQVSNTSSEIELDTLKGRIQRLEDTLEKFMIDQKLIIDFLGIERIEEPPRSYYKKKSNEKSNNKS